MNYNRKTFDLFRYVRDRDCLYPNHIKAIQIKNAWLTATNASCEAILIAYNGDHDNSAEKSDCTNMYML